MRLEIYNSRVSDLRMDYTLSEDLLSVAGVVKVHVAGRSDGVQVRLSLGDEIVLDTGLIACDGGHANVNFTLGMYRSISSRESDSPSSRKSKPVVSCWTWCTATVHANSRFYSGWPRDAHADEEGWLSSFGSGARGRFNWGKLLFQSQRRGRLLWGLLLDPGRQSTH